MKVIVMQVMMVMVVNGNQQEYQNLLAQRSITIDEMRLRHGNGMINSNNNHNSRYRSNNNSTIDIYEIEKDMECEVMIKDVIKSNVNSIIYQMIIKRIFDINYSYCQKSQNQQNGSFVIEIKFHKRIKKK